MHTFYLFSQHSSPFSPHFSFHLPFPIMSHRTEHCLFLTMMLLMLATCFVPSFAATDAEILLNFKSFLSNADDALNNWGGDSVNMCSWNGLICVNQIFHGLKLENMGLGGTIRVDILKQLSTLKTFSVMNNRFEGPMPEFKEILSLRALFLSNNKFSGEIPDDAFQGMGGLKRVFLAENKLTGHVPKSLAQLPRLLDVDLHGNGFDGNIPEFQQRDFRVFDLSNNQFEGPIPESLSNVGPNAFAGNQGLCGKPVSKPCISITPPSSAQNPPSDHQEHENKKHHHVLLTILVVVIVFVLALILALLFIRYSRSRKTAEEKPEKPVLVQHAQPLQQSQNSSAVSIEIKDTAGSGTSKNIEDGELNFVTSDRAAFDLQDLLRASAEVLGSGSFGSTYRAMVVSGPVVVVKRFKHMNALKKKEFSEHMKRLGKLSHPNLLPLVAFYYGKEEKLLVHDFAENGSLASHLHGRGGSELSWPTRLKIIKGVARGLAHLYREFPNQKIPHGHLKSSNVVLDHKFAPRLTDYGLVPVVEKKHAQQFMAAYKSPEKEGPSEKSDVWCLGILILEVLTGKFPANYVRHGKEGSEELALWVESLVREGWNNAGEVLDQSMVSSGEGGEMVKLLRIGMGCCEWSVESRLGWKEAVEKIEELEEKDFEEEDHGRSESSLMDHLSSSFESGM